MKFLILILVLAISAQPLQAGFCDMDMEKSQKTSHHMEHYDHDAHDFCVSDDTGLQKGCDNETNCGFCSASVSALPSMIKINATLVHHYSQTLSSCVVLPSHSSPPFRPPNS
jgi:hypothetical protein